MGVKWKDLKKRCSHSNELCRNPSCLTKAISVLIIYQRLSNQAQGSNFNKVRCGKVYGSVHFPFSGSPSTVGHVILPWRDTQGPGEFLAPAPRSSGKAVTARISDRGGQKLTAL